MPRSPAVLLSALLLLTGRCLLCAQEAPIVQPIDLQPLESQVERLTQALRLCGSPLTDDQQAQLKRALGAPEPTDAVVAIQGVLDPLCLAVVNINPESRVKVSAGPAAARLMEQGWRLFLVKVHNEAGVTAPLRVTSPNAAELHDDWVDSADPPQTITSQDVRQRWLDVSMYDGQPLNARLSGLPLEYRVIELFSRDQGQREAKLVFDVGQGTQDLGFRNELNVVFDCEPSVEVTLEVQDHDGSPTMGQFTIRDHRGRLYPARSRRLAPDFFFHDQVYRQDGESVRLPPGTYQVDYSRGPEYLTLTRAIEVPAAPKHSERFQLQRWINLAELGWYSGDHHVHAAGCGHYSSPTRGVEPQDMFRHIKGEDLNVGCVLSWGPCWYHQKQFFDGHAHSLSSPRHLMRYDVEVSGFPSSHAGHLVLLRLAEDDYPGTDRIEQWPTWNLPILQWARQQGGVVGYAHSGWGLQVAGTKAPTWEIPPFDGIGANEYIVDVTHGVVDFISTVDTPAIWELNIWYHTLNCGFMTRISGETDFPCIYGERVGLGRSYVRLPSGEDVDFDSWVQGLRDGRSYVSDGLTHLLDFNVNGLAVGEEGDGGRASVLAVSSGQQLSVSVKAAALLRPSDSARAQEASTDSGRRAAGTQDAGRSSSSDIQVRWDGAASASIRSRPLNEKPYWHIERARLGDSRQVQVELIVNGEVVDQQPIDADGAIHELIFEYPPQRSCWVALRVFPAAHTNPVFVEVDGDAIRASRRSAQWCLASVDRCWASKEAAIAERERPAAQAAYDHARAVYRGIEAEAFDDGSIVGGE